MYYRDREYVSEQFLDILVQIAEELGVKVKFTECEKNDYFSNNIWIRNNAYLEFLKTGKSIASTFALSLSPYGPEKRILEVRENGNRKILLSSSKTGNNWEEGPSEIPLMQYLLTV